MAGREQPSDRLWSFPRGTVGPDDSVKGFPGRVERRARWHGRLGELCAGRELPVITLLHQLHKRHHVVPAAAVERVSTKDRTVRLHVPRAQVEEAPEQRDRPAPLEPVMLNVIQGATATWVLSVR